MLQRSDSCLPRPNGATTQPPGQRPAVGAEAISYQPEPVAAHSEATASARLVPVAPAEKEGQTHSPTESVRTSSTHRGPAGVRVPGPTGAADIGWRSADVLREDEPGVHRRLPSRRAVST